MGYTINMQRTLLESLRVWKNAADRKPLLLRGARQVGKTWLMKHFGESAYSSTVYIDFFNNKQARMIFENDLKPKRIIEELAFISKESIHREKTLIIFDEIQECNRALNSLKYFCDEAPEYHIIAAGSFLGIALHESESFPVGKTSHLTLFPMTFLEFLNALGEDRLVKAIEKNEPRLINLIKNELTTYLKYYFYTGGMPEVVLAFTIEKNFNTVRTIQKRIINDYENDFSKHSGLNSHERIVRLWNSIPVQLAKEKKKFVYNDIKPGAKSRDYRSALFWLRKCGLVHEINRISLPHYPLAAYAESEHFKLYIVDIGLLSAMTNLDITAFLDRDAAFFNHFHGALAEQFALQEIIANDDIPVYYWAREGSAKAELDFIIQSGNKIIPLEIKAEKNLKAKSLIVFIDMYKPHLAIRSSMADQAVSHISGCTVYDVPLYMIGSLPSMLHTWEK
jgi:predicted AAA+ superfamily ATPase